MRFFNIAVKAENRRGGKSGKLKIAGGSKIIAAFSKLRCRLQAKHFYKALHLCPVFAQKNYIRNICRNAVLMCKL